MYIHIRSSSSPVQFGRNIFVDCPSLSTALSILYYYTRRRGLCANTTGEIEPNNSRWCIFTHLSIISVGNDLSNAPTDLPIKRVGIPTHRWDSRKFVGWNGSVFVVGRAPNRTETGQTWVATGKKKIPAFVCWFPNLILSSSVSLYSIQRWF